MAFEGLLSGRRAQVRNDLPRAGAGTTPAGLFFGAEGIPLLHPCARGPRPGTHGRRVHSSVLPRGSHVSRRSWRGIALLPVLITSNSDDRPDVSRGTVSRHGSESFGNAALVACA